LSENGLWGDRIKQIKTGSTNDQENFPKRKDFPFPYKIIIKSRVEAFFEKILKLDI